MPQIVRDPREAHWLGMNLGIWALLAISSGIFLAAAWTVLRSRDSGRTWGTIASLLSLALSAGVPLALLLAGHKSAFHLVEGLLGVPTSLGFAMLFGSRALAAKNLLRPGDDSHVEPGI
jgi:hypothetical protein